MDFLDLLAVGSESERRRFVELLAEKHLDEQLKRMKLQ